MRSLIIVAFFALSVLARGQELLVTSAGKYAIKDGTISLELSTPDKSHVIFSVAWKGPIAKEGDKLVQKGYSEGPEEPFPVAVDRWAFCFSGKDELWFYDGEGMFTYYKGTSVGLNCIQTCEDPNIGQHAPKTLKKWIEGLGYTISDIPWKLQLFFASAIHTGRGLKNGTTLSSPWTSALAIAIALCLILTVVLGVVLAFRFGHKRTALFCLVCGVLVPFLFCVAGAFL